jgi:hypothetical protein
MFTNIFLRTAASIFRKKESALKMEAAVPKKMLVTTYQTMWYHILEDNTLHFIYISNNFLRMVVIVRG